MKRFSITVWVMLVIAIVGANFVGTVKAAPAWQTIPPAPPTANAGPPNIIAEAGGLVTLNGTGSTGTGLTFQWQQIGGLAVVLNGATTPTATFIFPFQPGVALPVLTFQLTVTDILGRTATDTVLVTEERLPPAPALNVVPIPEPPDLATYVRDRAAAIRLGKALFWDMQLGSDGVTACASCHYAAGTDNRVTNQVNPGPDGIFDTVGPNGTLLPEHFPFHLVDPAVTSVVLRSSDDIVGTQGVPLAGFGGIITGQPAEGDLPIADPVFHVNGVNTRQVTARNAPSVINSIYNLRNFWDGRASFVFNGVSPFGIRDADARVWMVQPDQSLAQTQLQIQYASLASQAVGPVNSDIEMAWRGRSFPLLARKMYSLSPLALQRVDPTDSVLGPLVSANAAGLNIGYLELVQAAFDPRFWNSTDIVVFDALGVPSVAPNPGRPLTNNEFSLAEVNFSLFFGLALQLYQATLISDQTPYDRFQQGELTALTPQQQRGLDIFTNVTVCSLCHLGPEFTSATVSALIGPPLPNFPAEPAVPVERMAMADGILSVYDIGFYNIGVRPTPEDLGQGANDPFGAPLSWTRQAQLGLPIGPPLQPPPLVNPSERAAVNGAFKTPGLRNVELTAPYMHNGGMSTLEQVIDFYARGADFRQANITDLAPAIVPLPINDQDEQDLVAFLRSLTDERVRLQSAPFDHPQLLLPNGDAVIEFPATGAAGGPRIEPFVEINPALAVTLRVAPAEIRLGDTANMTVTVQNNGDVILRQVVASSSHCSLSGPDGDQWSSDALDPGESWDYTCQIAPTDAGAVLATVSGRHKLGQAVSANALQSIAVQKPALSVGVTANPMIAQPGQVVTYNYVVTNIGNVPLTGVTASDSRLGSIPLNSSTLAPGATATGSRTYVAQAVDILATVANTVQASAQPPLGARVAANAGVVVDVTGSAIRVFVQPAQSTVNVGEALKYDYRVRNMGDTALTSVSLSDSRLGSVVLTATTLASGQEATGSATTLITPADSPGPVVTTATASGEPAGGGAVSHTAGASVAVTGEASLAVSVNKPASAEVGSNVQYTYQITNNGPVPFREVEAHDTLLGALSLSGGLAPGQTTTAVAPVTVPETLLPGPLVNRVTVTGTTVAGLPVTTDTSGSLALTSSPRIAITQTAAVPNAHPGAVVTYTVFVQNTGNVSLRAVNVQSGLLGAVALGSTILSPGQLTSGTATHIIDENDLPGPLVNTMTAAGTPRYGNGTAVSATAGTSVALTSNPALVIEASANPQLIGVGNAVSYRYRVRNTGDVTLTNLVVRDDRTGVIVSPATTLLPGASVDLTASSVVQEADLPGPLSNNVSATALTMRNQVVQANASTSVQLTTGPAIQVTVSANPSPARIGDLVTFTYQVRNVGNITLNGITANDARLGAVVLGTTSLAPGQATSGTRTYTIAESDLPGPLVHTANAAGVSVLGESVAATGSGEASIAGRPALAITIQPDQTTIDVGDTMSVVYIVQNVGDVTFTDVTLSDARMGVLTLDRTTLMPGQNATGSMVFNADERDLDGPVTLVGAASGRPPAGLPTVTTAQSLQIALTSQSALAVTWTPDASSGTVNAATRYVYTLQNTGNRTLENLTVVDSRLGSIALNRTMLAPGESATGQHELIPTQADLPGPIVTQVSASGTPVYGSGDTVNATTSTLLPLTTQPGLLVQIVAPETASVGSTIQYTYRITNTGDVTLLGLQATDSYFGSVALATTLLAPGAGTWGTATLPVVETMLPGPLKHTLAVTAISSVGATVTGASAAEVTLTDQPALEITQQPNRTSVNIGDDLTFSVRVRNAGNATVRDLSVTSSRIGPLTLSKTELAPGETISTSFTDTVVEDDLLGIAHLLSAAARTKYSGRSVVTASEATVTVLGTPDVQLSVTAPATARIGETVTFQYTVQNSGNVTLDEVTLTDDRFGALALSRTALPPGESATAQQSVVVQETHLPGPLTSRAVLAAAAPMGQRFTAEQTASVAIQSTPSLAVAVTADVDAPAAGDAVRVFYEVRNAGDTTIRDVHAIDSRFGSIVLTATTLRPGERATGNIVHQIQPDDLIGAFIHTVTVTGVDSIGRDVEGGRTNTIAISGGSIAVQLIGEGDAPRDVELLFNGAQFEAAVGGVRTFEALHTGQYVVEFADSAAWTAQEAECDGGAWVSSAPSKLTISLSRGQTISCSYTLVRTIDLPGGDSANALYLPIIGR